MLGCVARFVSDMSCDSHEPVLSTFPVVRFEESVDTRRSDEKVSLAPLCTR